MSIGLLLITHGNLGSDMIATVRDIMNACPLQTDALRVANDCDPEEMLEAASTACSRLDDGDGVLVLTDLYGSTPSNIAAQLIERHNVHVISGINVPMLLRVMNYPDTQLEHLGEIAAEGARNGIVLTRRQQAS